jgi:hypothetical protein
MAMMILRLRLHPLIGKLEDFGNEYWIPLSASRANCFWNLQARTHFTQIFFPMAIIDKFMKLAQLESQEVHQTICFHESTLLGFGMEPVGSGNQNFRKRGPTEYARHTSIGNPPQ